MKRLIALLLAAALALSLVACGGGNTSEVTTDAETPDSSNSDHTHVEEVIPAVDPTCTQTGLTEGKRCSECGEILVEQEVIPALGHTTETGTCERCGQSFGIWEMGYYIDNFQEPIEGQWYIWNASPVVGTFSNSATTNSDLAVQMIYDYNNYIGFFLYEYGRILAKNVWDTDTYSITMRTPDGVDHELKGYFYEDTDRILITDANYVNDVITALLGEGDISFYLESGTFGTTSYLFTINTSNFAEEYNNLNLQ